MRPNRFAVLAAVLVLTAPARAAEKAPLVLEPSSPWVADFKDESCAIRRDFSGGGHQVTLQLDNFSLSVYLEVSLSSATLVPSKHPSTRFEPDDGFEGHADARITRYRGGSNSVTFRASILRQRDFDEYRKQRRAGDYTVQWSAEKLQTRAREITGLGTDGAFTQDILLKTGPLDKAMTVMQQCIDSFVSSKGLDPKVFATLSREPAPKQQMNWATHTLQDYPPDLVRERKDGQFDIRVFVDETGKIADCTVHPNGEDPRLDKAACAAAFKYAKFDPARDANGNPTKGFFSTRIVYSLK